MSDTPNLVLEHLRAIRADMHEMRVEQREQRGRLGAIERNIGQLEHEIVAMRVDLGSRFDRVLDRLDRVERRLELSPAE